MELTDKRIKELHVMGVGGNLGKLGHIEDGVPVVLFDQFVKEGFGDFTVSARDSSCSITTRRTSH